MRISDWSSDVCSSDLDGIARENVRIAGRDNDADAKIAKRPRRMFTARPATDIVARDQNRRALEIGTVEQIVGNGAQAFERAAPPAFARRRLPPVRGADPIGVDGFQPERTRAALDLLERSYEHTSALPSLITIQ